MFINIRSQIVKFSLRKEVVVKLEEQYIKTNWQDIIEKVYKNARNKSQALYITPNNELVVGVINNIWMQELSFYKEAIKKEINQKEKNKIDSVRLVINK